MKLKLVDTNHEMVKAWQVFFGASRVDIIHGNILEVPYDFIVSPANSFGFMDGGLDYHIAAKHGPSLQGMVQAEARMQGGEIIVGRAVVVGKVIIAPTMRVPLDIRGTVNAYLAMRAIMAQGKKFGDVTVACPGLGTGCGCLPPMIAARQMWAGYKGLQFPMNWRAAQAEHYKLATVE